MVKRKVEMEDPHKWECGTHLLNHKLGVDQEEHILGFLDGREVYTLRAVSLEWEQRAVRYVLHFSCTLDRNQYDKLYLASLLQQMPLLISFTHLRNHDYSAPVVTPDVLSHKNLQKLSFVIGFLSHNSYKTETTVFDMPQLRELTVQEPCCTNFHLWKCKVSSSWVRKLTFSFTMPLPQDLPPSLRILSMTNVPSYLFHRKTSTTFDLNHCPDLEVLQYSSCENPVYVNHVILSSQSVRVLRSDFDTTEPDAVFNLPNVEIWFASFSCLEVNVLWHYIRQFSKLKELHLDTTNFSKTTRFEIALGISRFDETSSVHIFLYGKHQISPDSMEQKWQSFCE